VPFPNTDRATRQHRPALVVSTGDIEAAHGLLWVVMVSSAANGGWPDVAVPRHASAGLPAPSVIRTAKVATIDASDAVKLGRVSPGSLRQVLAVVGRTLGASAP
jgi:mRNA interferase MazF